MKKLFPILILSTFLLSSCSTLFTGTKQTVQINSTPSGAKVQVDGIDRGVTPASIKLKRRSDGQTITLNKEGFETKSFQPETSFNSVSILNLFNLLFWGIDAATGALWKYDPKVYQIELTAQKK